jgi:opacity protein-like surface antigen
MMRRLFLSALLLLASQAAFALPPYLALEDHTLISWATRNPGVSMAWTVDGHYSGTATNGTGDFYDCWLAEQCGAGWDWGNHYKRRLTRQGNWTPVVTSGEQITGAVTLASGMTSGFSLVSGAAKGDYSFSILVELLDYNTQVTLTSATLYITLRKR